MTVSLTPTTGVSGSGVSSSGVVYVPSVFGPGWNQNDAGSGIVVAGDNLSLTSTAGAVWRSIRAYANGQNSKKYYEIRVDVASGGMFNLIVGYGTATAGLTNYVGADTLGWGIQGSGAKANNGVVGYASTFAVGDIIGLYLDTTTNPGKFYVHKNGVPVDGVAPLGNAAFSNVTFGTNMYPMASINGGSTTISARFASSAWTYTPASGFSSWL